MIRPYTIQLARDNNNNNIRAVSFQCRITSLVDLWAVGFALCI